ncbi:hypothetical protein M514_16024 [Trichuris suis]|uniref:Uncharacterized protein n=1 Tax=Trichuris suis TaxID=68888 RepID=A0A085NR18_9BILA|nr:hypothetical protein M514_16024 [Trichuris suis]
MDTYAAQIFLLEAQNLVKEKSYCLIEMFNFEETNLCLRCMTKSSYISIDHRHATGICTAKECATAMLGVNASGDFKLKPLVLHRYAN